MTSQHIICFLEHVVDVQYLCHAKDKVQQSCSLMRLKNEKNAQISGKNPSKCIHKISMFYIFIFEALQEETSSELMLIAAQPWIWVTIWEDWRAARLLGQSTFWTLGPCGTTRALILGKPHIFLDQRLPIKRLNDYGTAMNALNCFGCRSFDFITIGRSSTIAFSCWIS